MKFSKLIVLVGLTVSSTGCNNSDDASAKRANDAENSMELKVGGLSQLYVMRDTRAVDATAFGAARIESRSGGISLTQAQPNSRNAPNSTLEDSLSKIKKDGIKDRPTTLPNSSTTEGSDTEPREPKEEVDLTPKRVDAQNACALKRGTLFNAIVKKLPTDVRENATLRGWVQIEMARDQGNQTGFLKDENCKVLLGKESYVPYRDVIASRARVWTGNSRTIEISGKNTNGCNIKLSLQYFRDERFEGFLEYAGCTDYKSNSFLGIRVVDDGGVESISTALESLRTASEVTLASRRDSAPDDSYQVTIRDLNLKADAFCFSERGKCGGRQVEGVSALLSAVSSAKKAFVQQPNGGGGSLPATEGK